MCLMARPLRSANASSDATSSPGSMSTASFVVSQPTTKPFLKKGPTAWLSTIMVGDDLSRTRRPDVQLEDQDRGQRARRGSPVLALGRRRARDDAQERDDP